MKHKWAYIKKWEVSKTPKYSKITFPYYDAQVVEILNWLEDAFGNPSRSTYLTRFETYEFHPVWGAPETRNADVQLFFKNPKDLTFFILSCTK